MTLPSPLRGSVEDPFGLAGQTIEGKYRLASAIGDAGFGVVCRGTSTGPC